MTKQTKLSRREVIKILGTTAGSSLFANIPAKWSKPEVTSGSLPAHAQTSICTDYALVVEIIESQTGPLILGWLGSFIEEPVLTMGTQNYATYTLYWNCDPTCKFVYANMGGGTISATIRVTVMGGTPFEVPLGIGGWWWLYLNAATGVSNSGTDSNDQITVAGCNSFYID